MTKSGKKGDYVIKEWHNPQVLTIIIYAELQSVVL